VGSIGAHTDCVVVDVPGGIVSPGDSIAVVLPAGGHLPLRPV